MTGYRFRSIPVPGFNLVESTPSVGDEHAKRFGAGVTPKNQATLNIYTSGEFTVEIVAASFSQTMRPGDTSLDMSIAEFPSGSLCTERATAGPAKRLCLSPSNSGARWRRRIETLPPGGSIAIETGAIVIVASGSAVASGRKMQPGDVAVDCRIVESPTGARLVVASLM